MIGLRTSANHGSKSPRTSGRDYCRIIGLCECPGHPVKTPDSEPSIHGLTIVLAVFICRVVGCEEGTVVGCQKGIVAALADLSRSFLPYYCISAPLLHTLTRPGLAQQGCGVVSLVSDSRRMACIASSSSIDASRKENPPRAATLCTITLTDGEEFVAVLRQRRRRQSGIHLQMTNICVAICYDSCP
jgi:hypothetical protein